MSELLVNGPQRARHTLILAHGAGAAMDTPFMTAHAEGLAEHKIRVVRFEFPYMRRRREEGTKSPPDRIEKLMACWRDVRRQFRAASVFIGGKSMGGRVASMVAEEIGVQGLVCLGYPFHAVGKPENLRIEHLQTIETPTLIVQGERDTFGARDESKSWRLSKSIQFLWVPDGDHSFKPRKSAGISQEDNWSQSIEAVARFIHGQ